MSERKNARELEVFTVYDRVAQDYSPVACFRTIGEAVRTIRGGLKSNPNYMDFSLFHIGHFNQDTGVVMSHDSQEVILWSDDHNEVGAK